MQESVGRVWIWTTKRLWVMVLMPWMDCINAMDGLENNQTKDLWPVTDNHLVVKITHFVIRSQW